MKLRSFFALAALALASTTASAELICQDCSPFTNGTYLGQHWKGDYSTILGGWLADPPVPRRDDLFVIDINENATLAVAVTLRGLTVDVHTAIGYEECNGIASSCLNNQLFVPEPLVSKPRKLRLAVTPGRYVIRIHGTPTAAYSGTVSLRNP
jgi:hypothetical protein